VVYPKGYRSRYLWHNHYFFTIRFGQAMGNTELSNSPGDESRVFTPSRWNENHGNLLLGFVALILLFGASIIACRQTRFLKPRFPAKLIVDSQAIAEEEFLAAGAGEDRQVVSIRVLGAASDDGVMRLAVYTSAEGFNDPEKAFGTDSWRIRGGVCEGRFGLPADIKMLAIAAYHDANNNGSLDRNAFGIPSERYGFTRDARGITGPPTFDDAVVTLSDEPIGISIR